MTKTWRGRLAEAWSRTAKPKTKADAAYLGRYEPVARPLVGVAAVLPFAFPLSTTRPWITVLVGLSTWLVFLVDLVVQARRRERYLASRLGVVDLAIVVLTSPWYLIPGIDGAALVLLLRAARLARLVLVLRGAKVLIERLGRAALVAVVALLVFSWVAYDAEHPVNPEFASYGDSLWWGIVTMTTVGYGDIVPETSAGRYAGIMIMILGVALLGVLAGSLASFFRLSPEERQEQDDEARNSVDESTTDSESEVGVRSDAPPGRTRRDHDDEGSDLVREVIELRRHVAELSKKLDHAYPGSGPAHGNSDT